MSSPRGSASAASEPRAPSSSSSSPSSPCSLPSARSRCFLLLFLAALDFFFALSLATTAERLWSPLSRSSIFSARCSRASLRFCSRERVSWHLTTMPVGICLSWTAELVLFCCPGRRGQNWAGEGSRNDDGIHERRRTIFWPPGPLPLRYTSVNSCSGGGLGRGGYRVAPFLSGDVVEKGAAATNVLMLVLPAATTMCLERPWLLRAKPAGARGFIHHIAWLDCPVRAASYCQQHH